MINNPHLYMKEENIVLVGIEATRISLWAVPSDSNSWVTRWYIRGEDTHSVSLNILSSTEKVLQKEIQRLNDCLASCVWNSRTVDRFFLPFIKKHPNIKLTVNV